MRQYLVDAAAGHHVAAGEQRHQPGAHGSSPPSCAAASISVSSPASVTRPA